VLGLKGIRKATRAMEQHGLSRPQFEELSGEFVVTLIGPGERFMQEETPAWMQGLNERQIKALEYVSRQGRITNREYRELCDISRSTAKKELQMLVTRELLHQQNAGRYTHYVLSRDNGHVQRPLDSH